VNPGFDGSAIVYCQGAFNTTNGKTAHGLVRFTRRYDVLSVVDSRYAGQDAREVLDGQKSGITIYATTAEAVTAAREHGKPATHFVIGLAPDGGMLSSEARAAVQQAIELQLNVVCGLHGYLTDDPVLVNLARAKGVTITDVRKPPPVDSLHFFSGKIEQVNSFKLAVLGTDSAIGKRTTAWRLVFGLHDRGRTAEMIGTGQTAWLQGAQYGCILDCLVNDFVAGEIEHAVWSAWHDQQPEFIIIEGQGSLLNPAYPGGFEILAAGRPDAIILQHAPLRVEYDGFPGYKLHDLQRQIEAIQIISDRPVIAVTVNHEGIPPHDIRRVCADLESTYNIPAADVLVDGPGRIVDAIVKAKGKL
jgi:uncharacterized NAD-dependent epimerase/dehydratase family protein